MDPTPIDPELHRLFIAKADATITPGKHEELCRLLKMSTEVRQQWFAFQDAEAALLAWAQRETLRRQEETPGLHAPSECAPWINSLLPDGHRDSHERPAGNGATASSRRNPWRYLAPIAAAIIITTVLWVTHVPASRRSGASSASNPAPREEATTSSVAMISRGLDMEWDRSTAAPVIGAPLPPGVLRLQRGVAEIEFFQGARLCLQGPAEIRLISAGEAFCRSGRFSAHVPPQARGFRIGTPKGDIVDLGTDFGLDLTAATAELHVFAGEVELHQPRMETRKFTTGTAAGLEQPGQTLAANAAAFSFSHDLDQRVTASRREAFEQWQTSSARWNEDADLRLHFDFQDEEGARSLRNTAKHGEDIAAGTIVGCNWADGRWPGKRALQFRSMSDRVRLSIPGDFPQFTIAAWVQLHSLSSHQSQSSLCMSQGIVAGGIHWQILYDGSLCLGIVVSAQPKRTDDYISPVLFTPERFGQWTHLAAVFDTAGRDVRFYVNGALFSRHELKQAVVVSPGVAELGNWIPSPNYRGQHPLRNFTGSIDDFSFCARALTDDEIRNLAKPQ